MVPYTSVGVPGAETLDVYRPLARVTAVLHLGTSLALDAAHAFLERFGGVKATGQSLLGHRGIGTPNLMRLGQGSAFLASATLGGRPDRTRASASASR